MAVRKLREVAAVLACSLLFIQPWVPAHSNGASHTRGVSFLLVKLSGNTLTGTPRGVFPW